MRIIAGSLKGRSFASPHSNRTHPMSDKVRGALFNALGDLDGMSVLDVFAGTGALSFEAISRGALKAIALDSDKQAQRAIAENIVGLDLEQRVTLIRSTASSWLPRTRDEFDVVLIDPPYDDIRRDLILKVALKCKVGGVVVLSLPPAAATIAVLPEPFETLTQKTYGDATLAFYRRN